MARSKSEITVTIFYDGKVVPKEELKNFIIKSTVVDRIINDVVSRSEKSNDDISPDVPQDKRYI